MNKSSTILILHKISVMPIGTKLQVDQLVDLMTEEKAALTKKIAELEVEPLLPPCYSAHKN